MSDFHDRLRVSVGYDDHMRVTAIDVVVNGAEPAELAAVMSALGIGAGAPRPTAWAYDTVADLYPTPQETD